MRLGTRGSALALAQTQTIARSLVEARVEVEVVTITRQDTRAHEKDRWVRALQDALLDESIDIAVHSAKDVPERLPEGLSLLGTPARGPVEDVLIGAGALSSLPARARVGTSSPRRTAQLRSAREDILVRPLAGNIDTRLRTLDQAPDQLDAIVLARAGLERLGQRAQPSCTLDPAVFVPAPGQGTLALEGRSGDQRALEAVSLIGDARTFACLLAERTLALALGASCNTPIGALAHWPGATGDGNSSPMSLRAWVGLPDGSAWVHDKLRGDGRDPATLGLSVAERMRAAGASEVLARAETEANGRHAH